MNFLIIDTSSPQSFVALKKGGKIDVELLSSKQSQTLLPAIEKLLDTQSLDFIAIGTGPGAFTGTRVGVMVAKALAFAKGIPLLPFCSLKIFLPDADGPFALYGDAKSRGVYCLKGVKQGTHLSLQPLTLEPEGALSTTLNLPFLASFLIEKFRKEGGKNHDAVSPVY
ncbi:MAG: tRNA (adenosine(37)-N6)-threonylcarbamoyltransferase complex dimerization subunit type 1 TsaB [Chlamydiia bacterium]|nr:tRNA (adenosine(37)-N6)-threonylcarbamoyltransferase complex dimerization subunit type 1 TsaB [Chlamydiia bacterium]